MRPPVAPRQKQLPFGDSIFTWDTFEGFFCDFLAACPNLVAKDGATCTVASTSLYGRRGDKQSGIDIRAEMSNGEIWVFQCKHCKSWTHRKTKDAIAKCSYSADRKFLLITCEADSKSHDVIAEHPDWVIWDGKRISSEFLARLPAVEAARLLYLYFGPGWAERMLNLPGRGPLITAEAKCAPLLKEGRSFHHRLELIGHGDVVKCLDAFIKAKKARVFPLVGRGGLGKSRILREWSRDFASRHPAWTLRFVSDSPQHFGPALDSTAKPLVLVFDDAHRLDEIRRALFAELPSREDIKLVLALRPGPIEQIDSELTDAGFDLTQIEEPLVLKPLKSAQALELAEKALGPELANSFRHKLRDLSRDCPLLAVLAAELLKRGELTVRDFDDTREFQTHVFKALLRDAEPVERRFGETRTKDLLRLLALLAPGQPNKGFLERAANFLGGEMQPYHVREMLDEIDKVGLLLTTGAGVRITPDLLSDHLVYTACYDKRGGNTTFAERVMKHFSPDLFPRLIQHLAEAEWHAFEKNDAAESVVEPLWKWFIARFEHSSFFDRHNQIEEWATVAYFQPRRTLELAQIALGLDTAPPSSDPLFSGNEWDSHAHVLEALPSILKPLAEHHSEYVPACLDILWQIGRDRQPPAFASQEHPISIIGEIASYELWKPFEIPQQVLGWLETLLVNDDWLNCRNKPSWLLSQMLHPFFNPGLEERWRTGRTLHFRSFGLPLRQTAEMRDRVLLLCQKILARRSVPATLAVLEVIQKAIEHAHFAYGTPPAQFQKEWLVERQKALSVFEEIIRDDHQTPIILFRVSQILQRHLRVENESKFHQECRRLFDSIPDTLDLRVLRAALGNYWDDIRRLPQPQPTNSYEEAERRWEQFLRSTADAMLTEWTSSEALLARLRDWENELVPLDFHPNFRPLFQAVSEAHPKRALELAASFIAQPAHPYGSALDVLIFGPTKAHPDERLALCEMALATGGDRLIVGAINCLGQWRHHEELPPRAWELLRARAPNASARVVEAIVHFVWFSQKRAAASDWELLAALPADSQNAAVSAQIISCAADLLKKTPAPNPEIAGRVLAKLERAADLEGIKVEHTLSEFAKHYPGKVFVSLWRREQFRKSRTPEIAGLPFEIDSIKFPKLLDDPDAAAIVRNLETRLLGDEHLDFEETRILQIAIMQGGESCESHLLRLVESTSSPEQIQRLADFVTRWDAWPVILSCPDFVRALLQRAQNLNAELYAEISTDLRHLPGSRGFENGEPDEKWKSLLEMAESMAHRYANDAFLGPFYAAVASDERSWIAQLRKNSRERDEWLDD